MKMLVSFGQVHKHEIDGVNLDKDTLAMFDCEDFGQGRKICFSLFGPLFCTTYDMSKFIIKNLEFYPKGIVDISYLVIQLVNEPEKLEFELDIVDIVDNGERYKEECLVLGAINVEVTTNGLKIKVPNRFVGNLIINKLYGINNGSRDSNKFYMHGDC